MIGGMEWWHKPPDSRRYRRRTVAAPCRQPQSSEQPLLVYHWQHAHAPLPLRLIRTPANRPAGGPPVNSDPRLPTGPRQQPFDFCGHIRRLCTDVVARCAELRHIDVSRLLIAATQARSGRTYGLQARVTPLRFTGGSLTRQRRGVTYQVQRYFLDNHEYLYLMTFCLPRFLDQSFDDKFVTLFHELFHIGPAFDGDLRRHDGRYGLHTHSQKRYDERMAELARAYLACQPDPTLHAFLQLDFAQLQQRHGSVVAVVVPRPKVVPLQDQAAAARRGGVSRKCGSG